MPVCVSFLLLTFLIAPLVAGTPSESAFKKLRSLAGKWEGKDAHGRAAKTSFEVLASGTAVMENARSFGDGRNGHTLQRRKMRDPSLDRRSFHIVAASDRAAEGNSRRPVSWLLFQGPMQPRHAGRRGVWLSRSTISGGPRHQSPACRFVDRC